MNAGLEDWLAAIGAFVLSAILGTLVLTVAYLTLLAVVR